MDLQELPETQAIQVQHLRLRRGEGTRPRHPTAGTGAGYTSTGVCSQTYTRNMGSSMIPVSTPLSQCSHQRTSS